jgi:hypothetical protein
MGQAKQQAEATTGVSNVTYDAMAVLTNKLQGIAAIEGYKRDAQAQGDQEIVGVFEQIQQRDRQDVEQLRGIVAQRLR